MHVLLVARPGAAPPFFVLLVAGAVVLAALLSARSERRRREWNWARLAGQLQGRFTPANFFQVATIRFALEDRPSVLEFRSGRRAYTQLRVVLPRDPGGWMTVSRISLAEVFVSILEGRRLLTGDRLFDGSYTVRSTPESLGRRIFDPAGRQQAMTAVRRLLCFSGLSIRVTPQALEVSITEAAETPDTGMALVRTARELLKLLYAQDAPPALQSGEFTELLSGRCPICATALAEPLVRCSRCCSPHHRQCWDYLGHCATYGCDSTSAHRRAA